MMRKILTLITAVCSTNCFANQSENAPIQFGPQFYSIGNNLKLVFSSELPATFNIQSNTTPITMTIPNARSITLPELIAEYDFAISPSTDLIFGAGLTYCSFTGIGQFDITDSQYDSVKLNQFNGSVFKVGSRIQIDKNLTLIFAVNQYIGSMDIMFTSSQGRHLISDSITPALAKLQLHFKF